MMKKVHLLLVPESRLNSTRARERRICRKEWITLYRAVFGRSDDEQEYRWDHLGGYDAYIGRLKVSQPGPRVPLGQRPVGLAPPPSPAG